MIVAYISTKTLHKKYNFPFLFVFGFWFFSEVLLNSGMLIFLSNIMKVLSSVILQFSVISEITKYLAVN